MKVVKKKKIQKAKEKEKEKRKKNLKSTCMCKVFYLIFNFLLHNFRSLSPNYLRHDLKYDLNFLIKFSSSIVIM